VAGVIKMVLALRNQTFPATLHAEEPSPHIDWSSGTLRLLTTAEPWEANGHPRRAGVSSFGISGTNAHAILEEAALDGDAGGPPAAAGTPAPGPGPAAVPWVISGQGGDGLRAQAGRLRAYLIDHPEADPAGVGLSLATTRSVFGRRAVVTGSGRADLLDGLASVAAGDAAPHVVSGAVADETKVAFVFPGQGSQWAGMAVTLLDEAPEFAARIADCEQALAPYVDWSLTAVLRGDPGAPPLDRVDVVQPALFAIMVSLAALWRSLGVEPGAVVGHSQGEIAAAQVAGVLSLDDAAKVVALRSRALAALAGSGGMVSIAEGADLVRERLTRWPGRLALAAVNGPASVVVAGDGDALTGLLAAADQDAVRARRIPVDYASHSAQVEVLEAELAESLAGITPQPGTVPMFSTVEAAWAEGENLTASYWFRNLRRTVRFQEAVQSLANAGFGVFVEVSPHPVLTVGIQETLAEPGSPSPAAVTGTLRRNHGGLGQFLASAGQVFVHGTPVDWAAVFAGTGTRRVALPTYAFQRERYWPERATPAPATPAPAGPAPGGTSGAPVSEQRFWAAVERGDLAALAGAVGAGQPLRPDTPLASVLSMLSSWRRDQERTAVRDWRYRITWKPVPDPDPAPALTGTWLAVLPDQEDTGPADGTSLPDVVTTALGRHGASVIAVRSGPATRAGLAGLVRDAVAANPSDAGLTGVVSLLAVQDAPLPGHPGVPAGAAATLALVQALGDAGIQAPLWALTQGAVATGPADPAPRPGQAQTWGLGRVAALEHPGRWGGLIDLPAGLDARVGDRLCAFLSGTTGEDQIAVRAEGSFARRLVRAAQPEGPGHPWQPRGTVLVTGGTGGLGGRMARWLAHQGAGQIVLASRRGSQAPGAGRLAAELAGLGTAVSVTACDVADRDAVGGLLDRIGAAGPPLTAVVHTAGVAGAEPLTRTGLPDYTAVAAAKAAAAGHLDELTAGLDLDAFVLFSSAAGVWGSAGQAVYGAANAALDALAAQRRARGQTAVSLAWGLWGGGGMTGAEGGAELQRRGLRVMDPGAAIAALREAVELDETLLTVADMDWPRFLPVFTSGRPSPLLSDLLADQETAGCAPAGSLTEAAEWAGRMRSLTPADQRRALQDLVRGETAAALGYASADFVDPGTDVLDMGMSSVSAVELGTRLGERTGLELPVGTIYDLGTPEAIADFLLAEFTGGLNGTPPEGSAPN
jgi:acyl transferase domain-containing protein